MKATLNTFKGRDDYLELVRRFPLRKMRDPAEHTAALDMLRRLADHFGLDVGVFIE